ncbi:O-methyltransferase [Ignavibacteria bacterium]|nr:O-methyltransferase [Bacteroidota bacterium]MCZ2133793.1 O-methyltransferase [Bacteroidota bacterium]
MSLKPTPVSEKTAQYLNDLFSSEDDFLRNLRQEAAETGMPSISIGGVQGAFLQVMLRAMRARFVLEIGSLAGYSAITMARALPKRGKVVCMEYNPDYAAFIRRKADEAGLGDKIEIYVGDAKETLVNYIPQFGFDFVFIDADKPSYSEYLDLVYPLTRQGGIIAGDNALAWGFVAEDNPEFEPRNVKAIKDFNLALRNHQGLSACFVPIGDGMAMGVKL